MVRQAETGKEKPAGAFLEAVLYARTRRQRGYSVQWQVVQPALGKTIS